MSRSIASSALLGVIFSCHPLFAQAPEEIRFEQPPCEQPASRSWIQSWRAKKNGNQSSLSGQAASAVSAAKNMQVRNGEMLERTLWNHHFADEKLALSGYLVLDRLSRRSTGRPLEVFIATSRELEYSPTDPDFRETLDALDSQRVAAVREYARSALRRTDLVISLYDPPSVGMEAEEAATAYKRGLRGFKSITPRGFGGGGDPGGMGGAGDYGGGGAGGGIPSYGSNAMDALMPPSTSQPNPTNNGGLQGELIPNSVPQE